MDLMLDSFYNPQVLKQLYPAKAVSKDVKDKRLSTHFEFISRLLAKRATSLASFFLLPPLRYAPILDPTWEFAGRQQMLYDWQAILYLEACNLAGKHVEGLSSLAFLDSSYCRLSYLLNEKGVLKKDDGDQIKTLLRHALMHLGDTACIESTHSSAKDSMRDARSNFKSRVSKYYHCIASKVLSSRKTSHVTISEVEMATAKVKDMPSVVEETHPNNHKLNRQFQGLMKWKSGDHYWRATTASSLFDQVVALEWLLGEGGKIGQNNPSPTVSCLCGPPGSVIAKVNCVNACVVLAQSSYGFVGWKLEVAEEAGVMGQWAAYRPIKRQSAICFFHICDLGAWVNVPVVPQTKQDHGALVLLQTGDAENLCVCRVKQGLTLTVAQAKACVEWFGKELHVGRFHNSLCETHANISNKQLQKATMFFWNIQQLLNLLFSSKRSFRNNFLQKKQL